MSEAYQGSCLCGGITFEAAQIQNRMAHCHCTMCRKFHGAAFATFGEAKAEHFRWLKGEELLSDYRAANGTVRQFCANCGSSLRFIPAQDSGEFIEFSLAALDSNVPHRPDAHIFVANKASWYEITDQLPQHRAHRTGESEE